jgi:hypothetical protein
LANLSAGEYNAGYASAIIPNRPYNSADMRAMSKTIGRIVLITFIREITRVNRIDIFLKIRVTGVYPGIQTGDVAIRAARRDIPSVQRVYHF